MEGYGMAEAVGRGAPGPEAPEDDGTSDPGYQQALKFAMNALYKDGAAKQIAQQLTGAENVSDALADVAYNIVTIADERTEGAVADESLMPLAVAILEEVADIADAAGVPATPADLAGAVKTMILRYIGEQGGDTAQLQAAMDQIDPAVFEQAAREDA